MGFGWKHFKLTLRSGINLPYVFLPDDNTHGIVKEIWRGFTKIHLSTGVSYRF